MISAPTSAGPALNGMLCNCSNILLTWHSWEPCQKERTQIVPNGQSCTKSLLPLSAQPPSLFVHRPTAVSQAWPLQTLWISQTPPAQCWAATRQSISQSLKCLMYCTSMEEMGHSSHSDDSIHCTSHHHAHSYGNKNDTPCEKRENGKGKT